MNDWAEFRHFKYLLAIAEHKGFRAAAEYLHTAQPNLSAQAKQFQDFSEVHLFRKGKDAVVERMPLRDPLLTVEDVAARLNVTKDWVWDHSSRKAPYLPVIRMSDGVLRYRLSEVEEFVSERERLSTLRRRRR